MLASKDFIKAYLPHFIPHKASVSLSTQVSRLRVFLIQQLKIMFPILHFILVNVIVHTYCGSLRAF